MQALIVVNNPRDWPFHIPGVEVVPARGYLTDPAFNERRGSKVFNLCRSYRYQSMGYYVSLLAAARGHKPVPNVATIQDLKANEIVRIRSDELEELIQKSLLPIQSKTFVLSIYFGRNLAHRYDRLAAHLFKLFHAPFLRASFNQTRDGRWQLTSIVPISADDIPEPHREFVLQVATEYLRAGRWSQPRTKTARYELAILVDPDEAEPPSDERAITKFTKAAQALGMNVSTIKKDDYATLAEFDALFIRETTNVNHHTYRFARRALAEGLVVVDDPDSILRCTNKVYLQELLDRYKVPTPKTMVMHRDNVSAVSQTLGFPCILKQPDSAFSQGVVKVNDEAELKSEAARMLAKSDLVIAQEYLPTEFDWRVGVFDGQPLWVAKYFMAHKHWQIYKNQKGGRIAGKVQCVKVEETPEPVIKTALRATKLIGNGLYGVDIKTTGKRTLVVEVNDNPSLEAGYEDQAEGDKLYERIMTVFLRRLEARFLSGVRA